MFTITLKDGNTKTFDRPMTIYEIAASISEGLARVATAAQVNGELCDLRDVIDKDCELSILTFADAGGAWAYRHTASHALAHAVKRLYPAAKLAIGPATDDGFYYDIDNGRPFTSDEIKAIEQEMQKIIKEALPIERYTLPRAEALAFVESEGETYKTELINDLPEDAVIMFYKQGDFVDLCAGPHLADTGKLKAVKLYSDTGSSGAYWRGDVKRPMLSRIYGTAFTKKSDLEAFIEAKEEAKKRDHNKLGRELGYFTTSELIGQGLVLFMPKGAKVMQIMQRFVEDEEERRGYVLTKTPYLAKSDLYKVSGHWDKYREGMFVMGDEDEPEGKKAYALRPMTCPFQFEIYNAGMHSYRDLPIRYSETSTLFRNEDSGEMHGIIRLRQFTISEAHLICTPEQIADEFKGVLDLARYMLDTLGLSDDISYRFSKWDSNNRSKYIGDEKTWEESQGKMKEILDEIGLDYTEAEGEAAFYGPKLDIEIKNVHGKQDTLITIQIDFALAEKFDMTYIDTDGQKKRPVVIHRTSIGCYERTLALLIEKYAASLPTWLSPTQAIILPISDKFTNYAKSVEKALVADGIRATIDTRAEKIGYKIREARNERIPYILVVGEKEAEEGTVSLRSRAGDEGSVPLAEAVKRIVQADRTRENDGAAFISEK
ncbi:MAG: threonine--tRNA ligase [Defluviitaleaceae bacterium]|nr:threonine--tRNA ligase [Defluviitaleaceae bacterium]